MAIIVWITMLVVGLALLFRARPFLAWALPLALGFLVWIVTGPTPVLLFGIAVVIYASALLVFGVPSIRRDLVTKGILARLSDLMPTLSDTERLALEAGTIWWDGDLFSGRPDWDRLSGFRIAPLSEKEQAFLDGPVEELCRRVNSHEVWRNGDLDPATWEFLKQHRFFGMIIPEEYGGLGFSAQAHSAVITKISSRSVVASVTVMVPNSLGPAELLLHYGTDDQKRHYLPRLARGEEVPAFALTEPEAGSDAAGGRARGVICRGVYQGKEVLGMRLTWDKRYITLSPVATVLGVAFRLHDPEQLLGGRIDLGITCALVPTHLPGVEIGERHDPLGVPFLNGPTRGHDVFVPLDAVIGGPAMAGQGWRMLMESLAAGRSISLPALSVGAVELAARVTGAYATVREQFNVSIGRFEGIQERLGRIGGMAYLMNATRRLTAGAVDAGEKPSVVSAMVKAYLTEHMRASVNDAMDVVAGAGISRGPRNTLAHAYASLPIGITVEGANILTRSLIVFGQGAIRCHPWVLKEIHAVADHDLAAFDRAFWKHIGFTVTNGFRAFALGILRARPARPGPGEAVDVYFGELSRLAAAFAFLADVCLATLGGALKRKEMLSGRMADALAWMYMASAVLKRYQDEGRPERDHVFVRWGVETALANIQNALVGVLDNFPGGRGAYLRPVLFPLGARYRPPSDKLIRRVAAELVDGREGRLRLTADIFVPEGEEPGLAALETTLALVVAAAPLEKKLRTAQKDRRVKKGPRPAMIEEAFRAEILTAEERDFLLDVEKHRVDAIQVDAFPPDYFGPGARKEEAAGAEA